MSDEPLKKKIIQYISSKGTISFCDFMEMALYDCEFGYYFTQKEKIGRLGDFYTSTNLHQTFGVLLAKQCLEMYCQQEEIPLTDINTADKTLNIVEIGAGTGQLAFDILWALQNDYGFSLKKVKYFIQEISPVMQKRQKALLTLFSSQIEWLDLKTTTRFQTAIILANEVVDAFPIHQFRFNAGELEELHIDVNGDKLIKCWKKIELTNVPSDVAFYLQHLKVDFLDKQIIEVNLQALRWLKQVTGLLKQGFIIILDYGDLSDQLHSIKNFQGTLRCFFQHTVNENYLQRIGEQDITASVNFEILMAYASYYELEVISFMRQTDYLIKLGLLDRLQKIVETQSDSLRSLKARMALKNFFIPGGISEYFKVLILGKGFPNTKGRK